MSEIIEESFDKDRGEKMVEIDVTALIERLTSPLGRRATIVPIADDVIIPEELQHIVDVDEESGARMIIIGDKR